MFRPAGGTALATLLLSIASPVAAAQESGVTVDPSSPSSKEYSLPFEEAREQADPNSGAKSRDSKPKASAFGEGVESQTTTPGEASGDGGNAPKSDRDDDSRNRGDSASAGSSSGSGGDGGPPAAKAEPTSAASPDVDSGSGEMLAVGAIGSGILILGVVCGLFVRRRLLADSH